MISIINYGMGNLGSIQNMLKKIGIQSNIVENPNEISNLSKLILPGVGSFDEAMKALHQNNWVSYLNQKVLKEKIPILGICLGMQLMTDFSEEGTERGLGWINGGTLKFDAQKLNVKVPHMGWNVVIPSKESDLFYSNEEELRFYHVHSFYAELKDKTQELASTNHGINFTSAFGKENILGVQFHPEKSHKFGMQLLRNFYEKY